MTVSLTVFCMPTSAYINVRNDLYVSVKNNLTFLTSFGDNVGAIS